MTLPHEVRVLPGHTDETTIGREWEENPFVRYWRGEAASIDEPVRVGGDQGPRQRGDIGVVRRFFGSTVGAGNLHIGLAGPHHVQHGPEP